MLSRIADSLFWTNRYMERADGLLRCTMTNYILMFDKGVTNNLSWQHILQIFSNSDEASIEAMQFNTDATAALAGLLQNLQGARQQLDQALGVVTGQSTPTIPGQDEVDTDLGAEMGADVGADIGAEMGAEELPPEEPDAPEMGGAGLGRAKR